MKKISIFVLLLFITNSMYSQELNKIIFDEIADETILFGYCDKEGFSGEDFNFWFQDEYDHYTIDKESLDLLDSDSFSSLQIKVVMGTWCGDSQREVPRLIKILDYLEFDYEKLIVIGVNRNKKAEGTEANELNIEFVPTIVFYFENKEIGRIIESPAESLEKDIVNFISEI